MSRAVKEMIESDLRGRYKDLDSALVVSMHGLSGVDANLVRRELRKKKIEVHVIKNRAAKRVFAGTRLEPLAKALRGPCALVTGEPGVVETAQELIRLAREYPKLDLRVGVVEGEDAAEPIEAISKRRSKAELQGEVLMLAISPGRRIAGCLRAGGKIAGCIKALAAKLENGEAVTKVA